MKNYFVYVYKFNDGGIYIGRSNDDVDRFGNVGCYKNQYVHSKMLEDPDFEQIKVYGDNNIFTIYHLESVLINHYKMKLGSKCYNGDSGYNWYQEALKDLSYNKDHKMEDVANWIHEYKATINDAVLMCLRYIDGGAKYDLV